MAKPKEQERPATIIPLNEYQPELEALVKYHLAKIPPQVKNTIKYSIQVEPDFKEGSVEQRLWRLEEIRRCREGYNGMSPKMYFFYNYCWLKDPELGFIRPQYRKIAADWFQFIDDHQAMYDKRGIVSIKRRRVGASFMAASDVLQDCLFTPGFSVGMNSMSEGKSRDLFKHVKMMYQKLPQWLRPRTTASDRRDYMHFAYYEKDAFGNRITKGLQSSIISYAPTDNCYESGQFGKILMDEGGKTPNLATIWSFGQDCLMKPPRMVGQAVIFGTVGDITKDGRDLKDMWDNHEVYKFDRFFFGGYNALDGMIDEYGNDDYENGIRWILYERHSKKAVKREYETHKQKYPLDERDAFNQMLNGGVGNITLINDQITKLIDSPPEKRTGWMRPRVDGGVDFVPHENGKIIVYELPDHKRVNGYVAGADPADHDDLKKNRDVSNLAMTIMARPYGVGAPKIVLEYVDRPEKLDSFFEQSAMALRWYNNTKVLIEDNRARMLIYFLAHYPKLLPLVPKSIESARGTVEMKHSVKMNEQRKQQMMGLIESYVDDYSQHIPSIRLLEEFKVFADPHSEDDYAISFGWALVLMQSMKQKIGSLDDFTPPAIPQLKRASDGTLYKTTMTTQTKFQGQRRLHPFLNR